MKLTLCLMIVFGIQSTVTGATAIATVGPNTPAPNIFFSGACNGTFKLLTDNAFIRSKVGFGIDRSVRIEFSLMRGDCASFQINSEGIWHLGLEGANGPQTQFSVRDNQTGSVLLRGRFIRAILHGRSGSSSLALTLPQDNVRYSASLPWFPESLPLDGGSLAIAILSQVPVIAADNGPQQFIANGDTNFGAQ